LIQIVYQFLRHTVLLGKSWLEVPGFESTTSDSQPDAITVRPQSLTSTAHKPGVLRLRRLPHLVLFFPHYFTITWTPSHDFRTSNANQHSHELTYNPSNFNLFYVALLFTTKIFDHSFYIWVGSWALFTLLTTIQNQFFRL